MGSKQSTALIVAQPSPITATVAFDPLAVDRAKAEALEELHGLQSATIDNDVELAEAAEMLRDVVAERKAIETMRDGLRSPAKALLKAVDNLFAVALDAKTASEAKLRSLVGAYQVAKAAEQRRLMVVAREAATAREPAALTTALVAATESAPMKIEGVGVREIWTVKRIAAELVPYEWCVPDESRIKRHARETPIDRDPEPIPGVIFERAAQTTVR